MHGRELNLSNPRTFTEKLAWMKVYDSTFLKTFAADKFTVHEYYALKLGKDIGIKPIGIYNNVDEINWDKLPNDIVIKCNHGSGYNKILHGKRKIDLDTVVSSCKEWLSTDYSSLWGELHYKPIPRKIIIEPYIGELTDTKLFCFNGIPRFYQIDRHFSEHRMNFYDMSGNPLTWLSRASYPADYTISDPVPHNLNIMAAMAVKLAKPFKFVRVDFYNCGTDIYGGELTFIPGGANQSYIGDGDERLGAFLKLTE